jgi:hypothetical protein
LPSVHALRCQSLGAALLGVTLLALALPGAGCSSADPSREQCLAQLDALVNLVTAAEAQVQHSGAAAASRASTLRTRLARLRSQTARYFTHDELAWILVPALGLEYRLRRGDGPQECHALLVGMGLMAEASAAEPLTLEALRRIVNRAALPETELLLPGPGPLPGWLRGQP